MTQLLKLLNMIQLQEIDTIKSENNFLNVADILPVSPFDDHDLHIKEHQKFLDEILKEEETALQKQKIIAISEHIELHKGCKRRRKFMYPN